MRTHVRAVVVGGGAVGAGIAYALAKAGWTDTVLLERDELTSGSTWHAAGLLPLFNMGYATSHIHDHSVKLYKTLEAETGLNAGFSVVGNLRMAQTQARMDEYQLYATTAETVGIPYEWMTPAEIKSRWPLVRTEDLIGALFHPTDGYINPADVTQAMAKGARQMGVEIVRRMQVDAYDWTGSEWIVSGRNMIEKGGNLVPGEETFQITAEHVVTATGNHAQRTAGLLGLKIPAIPVEHQFIVTEPDPALLDYRKTNPEHPVLRDADAKWYVREERGGWILGPYEKNAPARFEYAVPDSFRADLFPLDLERIEEEYMSFIHRIPSSENCGLKDDFNGPICYTPDGNPLVGPAPGLRNMWLAEGFSFGITAAGGVGHYLAQMMTAGEAEIDMASLDPKRFGGWMTTEYAARKNEEAYDHVFILHHPDEERPACRPLRTAPCYDRMKARGAQFGVVNGFERPNYFGPLDAPDSFDHDARSFRRGAWWKYAVEEARAIRENVGLIDASAFTKHIVRGPGATAFLDWFTTNRLPKIGRINLTYALTGTGTTRTEYTIQRRGEHDYYLVSAGALTAYDGDYLRKAAEDRTADFGPIEIHDVTTQHGVFALAGPNSRALLAKIIRDADPATALSNKRFPWLSARRGRASDVPGQRAARRLYRRTRLGTPPPHRDAELPLRPPDGSRRTPRPENRRRPRPELAASGKILPRLRHRTRPRRHSAGGRPRPLRRSLERLPRQGGDGSHRHPQPVRHPPDRRSRRRRPLGPRGALRRRRQSRPPHLRRLFGGVRQEHRHGLRHARPRRAGHEAQGQDAEPPLGLRGHRRQPLRPEERNDPC